LDIGNNPKYENLEKLNEELKNEPDEKLLTRKYMFWDKEKNNTKVIDVESYFNVLKNGGARKKENLPGIFDNRIQLEHGISFLQGFLIVSFGSQRVLLRKLNHKKVNYRFFIIEN